MKTRSRRRLRALSGLFAGVMAFSLMGRATALAATHESLADLSAGAAEVLDAFDSISQNAETEDSSSTVKQEQSSDDSDESDERKSGLVMADVKNSLNVREEASEESSKVGLLYADCGGEILDSDGDWTKIKSGNLVGWAHNDYLLFGEEAKDLAHSVGRTIATVNADALRVRKEPDEDAGVYGLVKKGDEIEAIVDETTDEWVAIDFEGDNGYISAEYVSLEFSVDSGETYEEIKERERKEREEKAKLIANLGAVAVGTTDDVLLGALVQCEAGNQPYEGQLAVAAVVMNRVRSGAYPNTIASVIYASGQFTPAGNGKVEDRLNKGVKESCLQAAREAINGATNVGTATHFRRAGNHEGVVIGAHVFW